MYLHPYDIANRYTCEEEGCKQYNHKECMRLGSSVGLGSRNMVVDTGHLATERLNE